MTLDLVGQLDVVVRLCAAAVLGALIGLEREIHDHPAGMRTHLLVALGSAGFTVLSIEAFAAPGADPARIAAQIVAGVGFLGAGAILKEGATIRGLTTAASLWTVAAVGMAAGAGAWIVAAATTILALVSLWPLRVATERFVGHQRHRVHIQLVTGAHGLGELVRTVVDAGGSVAHLGSSRAADGRLSVTIEIHASDTATGASITAAIGDIEGVDLVESKAIGD